MKLINNLLFFITITSILFFDLYSDISGQSRIKFKADKDGPATMELNSNGLGLGISPSANLHVSGTLAYNYQLVSSDLILSGNTYILANSSNDNIILTLPYAGNVDGRVYKIKKTSPFNYLSIVESDPSDESEYIFDPSASDENLPYAEFLSASNSWHLLSRNGISERWDPLASSNITVWLDATDNTSITSSADNVSQWNDKSGNDYHVSQTDDDKQPKTGSRTINGLNGIDFDGSSDTLKHDVAFFTSNQSYTKVIIYFIDNTANSNNTLTIGNSAFYNEFIIFHSGTQVTSSSYPGVGIPMIVIGTYESGVRADLYINGTSVGNNTTPPSAWANNTSNFLVGSYGNGNYLDGVLGEALIFNHDVDESVRQKIEGYLAWKWGLRTDLPADHPYKNTPPTKE